MSIYIGVGAAGPSSPLTLGDATNRVAALLRRGDINLEIQQWLNFSLRELTDRIDFPELRVTGQIVTLVGGWNIYSLPTNFSHVSSVHYTDQTLYPSRGWNLTPMPREFYKGDTVDLEKLANRSVPSMGDPLYYAIDRTSTGLANASDGTFGQTYLNFTGTVASGSPTVTGILPSTAGLSLGNVISGAGIPTGTTILSIDSSTQVTMTANATISQSNEGMTSAPALGTPGGPVLSPAIVLYPAFIYTKKGQLEVTYYRLPADWTNSAQTPDIDARWRHYLVYMAYKWGVIFTEKGDNSPMKIKLWQDVIEDVVGKIRGYVKRSEDRTIVFDMPAYGGLEGADSKY